MSTSYLPTVAHAWRWSWRHWRRVCQIDGRPDCPHAAETRRQLDYGEVWDA